MTARTKKTARAKGKRCLTPNPPEAELLLQQLRDACQTAVQAQGAIEHHTCRPSARSGCCHECYAAAALTDVMSMISLAANTVEAVVLRHPIHR